MNQANDNVIPVVPRALTQRYTSEQMKAMRKYCAEQKNVTVPAELTAHLESYTPTYIIRFADQMAIDPNERRNGHVPQRGHNYIQKPEHLWAISEIKKSGLSLVQAALLYFALEANQYNFKKTAATLPVDHPFKIFIEQGSIHKKTVSLFVQFGQFIQFINQVKKSNKPSELQSKFTSNLRDNIQELYQLCTPILPEEKINHHVETKEIDIVLFQLYHIGQCDANGLCSLDLHNRVKVQELILAISAPLGNSQLVQVSEWPLHKMIVKCSKEPGGLHIDNEEVGAAAEFSKQYSDLRYFIFNKQIEIDYLITKYLEIAALICKNPNAFTGKDLAIAAELHHNPNAFTGKNVGTRRIEASTTNIRNRILATLGVMAATGFTFAVYKATQPVQIDLIADVAQKDTSESGDTESIVAENTSETADNQNTDSVSTTDAQDMDVSVDETNMAAVNEEAGNTIDTIISDIASMAAPDTTTSSADAKSNDTEMNTNDVDNAKSDTIEQVQAETKVIQLTEIAPTELKPNLERLTKSEPTALRAEKPQYIPRAPVAEFTYTPADISQSVRTEIDASLLQIPDVDSDIPRISRPPKVDVEQIDIPVVQEKAAMPVKPSATAEIPTKQSLAERIEALRKRAKSKK